MNAAAVIGSGHMADNRYTFRIRNMPVDQDRKKAAGDLLEQQRDNPELIGRAVTIDEMHYDAKKHRWVFSLTIYTDPIDNTRQPRLVGEITLKLSRLREE